MFISYLILRLLTFPFGFFSYKMLHFLGKHLGTLSYYLIPKYRKRALSNIALADLGFSLNEIRNTAKKSLQNLMITCLEYPKLSREKDISRIASVENPQEADRIMAEGKGLIFFCGHQANWELLFLEGTFRMPGVAIGRPIKNHYLYNWILSIREKFGGKIITPKNGLKEGLRALKKGAFLGIVGDQGMPDSGFSSSFLGREAWTSPAPAMLAYKTNTPMIVATTRRENGKYLIHYSKAFYPNSHLSMEQEVIRLMKQALALFEQSVRKCPGQWLWVHNRWKQQTLDTLKRPYRQDSLAVFLSEDESLMQDLSLLRLLYPTERITLFVPKNLQNHRLIDAEIYFYEHLDEVLQKDFRFKLIYNFTESSKIDRHYKKYATQYIAHPKTMKELERLVKNG